MSFSGSTFNGSATNNDYRQNGSDTTNNGNGSMSHVVVNFSTSVSAGTAPGETVVGPHSTAAAVPAPQPM